MNTLSVEFSAQSCASLSHQRAIEGRGGIDATVGQCKKLRGVYSLRIDSRWEHRD